MAAPDKATLREARQHLVVRTEPLEAVLDALESEQQFAAYESRASGDAEAAFADAALVVEGEYRVGHQEQLYIENQAMIAEPRADGGITITGSMQCPYYVHERTEAGTGPERLSRPSSRRPRPAAASAARRTTRRSWQSTRPCWRSGWASRCA